MNNRIKRTMGLVIIVLVLFFIVWYVQPHKHLTLVSLRENKEYLELFVATNYIQSVIMYLLFYSSLIALAIPGVPLLTMLGGFLFGFVYGGVYALIGAVIGTSISFMIIRYVFSNIIRGRYAQKLHDFNEKLKTQGVAAYLLTLHLMGLIPYFVINTLAALAGVAYFTFFWTTLVGSIPIVFIYSFAGQQLYLIESIYDIFSTSIVWVLIALSMFALLPLLFRWIRNRGVRKQ